MGKSYAKKGRKAAPTAFDCFAGCGGMTEGFRQAGYRVVGAVESDPIACDVYALNHPKVELWRQDVCNVTADEILTSLKLTPGELDLLGGCPPCQGFSTLRTYNGGHKVEDTRNDLIFEFQRLALGLKPKWVMLENVPALFGDHRFSTFKAALIKAGYSVEAKILNVADFGVPQRRRRVILIASLSAKVRFANASKTRRTVRDAIGSLAESGESGDALHDIPEARSSRTKKLIASIPSDGGSRSSLPSALVLECHKQSAGFRDVYGRMAWDKQAPTITTGCFNPSKGRFLHPTADRAITMREAALLQSFPPSYKFPAELGKVRIAGLIGNALPPAFIRRHTRAIASRGKISA